MQRRLRHRGFTLMELMVSLVSMAILLGGMSSLIVLSSSSLTWVGAEPADAMKLDLAMRRIQQDVFISEAVLFNDRGISDGTGLTLSVPVVASTALEIRYELKDGSIVVFIDSLVESRQLITGIRELEFTEVVDDLSVRAVKCRLVHESLGERWYYWEVLSRPEAGR